MERENTYEKLCPYVEKAKNGDEQAFEYLYHYTYEATRVFVSNFCNNQSEVDDIVQEIYLEVFRFLPTLKDNMVFCAWQRRVAYHCCLKTIRKQKDTSIDDEKVEHIKNLMERAEQAQDIILDCNVNAVKNLLFHRRKNLKKQVESLPLQSFESVKTPEIKLETESLKGIEIPKPEPVQKKIIKPVYMKVLKEDEEQKRLTAYVQGDVADISA